MIREERRAAPRRAPTTYGLDYRGRLRTGTAVAVLNISPHGALVESMHPCRPGGQTELHLDAPDGRRRHAGGEVLRCWVASLRPLRFRAAVAFSRVTDLYGSADDEAG